MQCYPLVNILPCVAIAVFQNPRSSSIPDREMIRGETGISVAGVSPTARPQIHTNTAAFAGTYKLKSTTLLISIAVTHPKMRSPSTAFQNPRPQSGRSIQHQHDRQVRNSNHPHFRQTVQMVCRSRKILVMPEQQKIRDGKIVQPVGNGRVQTKRIQSVAKNETPGLARIIKELDANLIARTETGGGSLSPTGK